MTTKAIVGMTLCLIGVLVSATFYGLFVAPLFLLPGIPLIHVGLRTFKTQHNRTSAALVVTLTLSYVAVVCAVALFVWTIVVWQAENRQTKRTAYDPTKDPQFARFFTQTTPSDTKNDESRAPTVLAQAYRARTTPLSQNDTEILLRYGGRGREWNRISAPLIRDYLDPRVTAEQWVERAKAPLGQLRTVVFGMKSDCQLLSDEGSQETLKPIVETYESLLGLYHRLRDSIINGDTNVQPTIVTELQAVALRKQQLALPIVKSLRQQMGSEYMDQRIQEMITELGTLTTPK